MRRYEFHAGGMLRTNSGIYIDPFNPNADEISIYDIAHALSMIPRFGGHLNSFYSVAQHSVDVMKITGDNNKLQALMHDASEAYLLDIPTPIKSRLVGYSEAERNMMNVIASVFGFEWPCSKEVKDMDNLRLEVEWRNLVEYPESSIMILQTQSEAKEDFLYHFNKLTKGSL